MSKGKKFFKASVMVLLVVSTTTVIWALDGDYNRPNPLLDYVPQEIGLYDTFYDELVEADCRNCHGNSLADRHHDMKKPSVLVPGTTDLDCLICHTDGDPSNSGAPVTHDCKTSGCHSLTDVQTGNQRWHHNTEAAAAFNCTQCHSPKILGPITSFQDFLTVPPTHITPMPFSCENCHWDQDLSGIHPYGSSGQYGKSILGNYDTHHMGFTGRVGNECYLCHAGSDVDSPDWDTTNREIIRYCEKCHTPKTLHAFSVVSPDPMGITPHVSSTDAWEAAGFHVVGDAGETDPTDVNPTTARTFVTQEMCNGCHADYIPQGPATPVNLPVINADGINPTQGQCYQEITLTGSDFGPVFVPGASFVQMSSGSLWINMPIDSWTDNQVVFTLPCQAVGYGMQSVRIITVAGTSNTVSFMVTDGPSLSSITPATGDHGQWLTLTGSSFGTDQTAMHDDVYGLHTQIELSDTKTGSSGMIVLLEYQNWTDTSIEGRFNNYYVDSGLGSGRNYVQDPVSEPTILAGEGLYDGDYNVVVRSIIFMDNDLDDTLSIGDTVVQTMASDPQVFTRVKTPSLWSALPSTISGGQILTLYGVSLGTSGSGTMVMYGDQAAYDGDTGTAFGMGAIAWSWSNTRIMIDVPAAISAGTYKVWIDFGSGIKSNPIDLTIY